jgi:hypothetical protein
MKNENDSAFISILWIILAIIFNVTFIKACNKEMDDFTECKMKFGKCEYGYVKKDK